MLPALALAATQQTACLIAFRPELSVPAGTQQVELSYNAIKPSIPFDEVIPSWNVENGQNAEVQIFLRAHVKGADSPWYCMGNWSLNNPSFPRESVAKQSDDIADVQTDTLHLKAPVDSIDLRVVARASGECPRPKLDLLTLCFSNGDGGPLDAPTPSPAWGKVIEVPQRAQGNYPNGGVLCSATSVSMLLWHYSNVLGRPELNNDVPEVEKGVWDVVYDGAGNWPFNTAYAGSFPGMRAYVSRFNSITDLEAWIAAGYPVICSAPLDMLEGKPHVGDSGHLVVLVGFTKDGDPVFNDPAKKAEVRRTYHRADFDKAWAHSRRTVYLIYPANASVPASTDGLWIGGTL